MKSILSYLGVCFLIIIAFGEVSSAQSAGFIQPPTAAAPSKQTAQPRLNPAAYEPTRSINLNAYPYDRRIQLRSVLETRMTGLDKGIEALRSKINARPANGGSSLQDRISDIEQKYDGADERLKGLEATAQENWNNYKRQLRDEIASLEEAYHRLQIATK